MSRSAGVRAVVVAVSLLAACAGDPRDDEAGDDRERRLVRELEAAGYYEATGEHDRRAVVRLFAGVCDRLDNADGDAARYDELVALLRASGSISATGGWPRARVAGVAVPILCPRHGDVVGRAVATVS